MLECGGRDTFAALLSMALVQAGTWGGYQIEHEQHVMKWLNMTASLPVAAAKFYNHDAQQYVGGVVATRTIHCGEVLASVPLRHFLRPSHRTVAPVGAHPRLVNLEGSARSTTMLGIALIHEALVLNTTSKWHGYLRTLPSVEEAISSHPWFWYSIRGRLGRGRSLFVVHSPSSSIMEYAW